MLQHVIPEALIRKLHEQGITFDKLSEFDQQTRRQFYDFITGLEADEKFEQAKDHIKRTLKRSLRASAAGPKTG